MQLDPETPGPPDDERPGADDADLFDRLAAQNFTGPEYEAFCTQLVLNCHRLLCGWIRSGRIYSKCAEEGRGVTRGRDDEEVLRRDRDERDQLVDETITKGLRMFTRYGLREGNWRPDGGRSLQSYFDNACVREFAGVFRRWRSDRRRQPPSSHYGLDPAAGGVDPADPGLDPADRVVAAAVAAEEIATMKSHPRVWEIAKGLDDGLTYQQIGVRLGITARAVEGIVYRYRRTQGGPR